MEPNRLPKKLALSVGLLALGAPLAGCVVEEPSQESTEAEGGAGVDQAGAGDALALDAACLAEAASNETAVRSVATIIIGGAASSSGGSMDPGALVECPDTAGASAGVMGTASASV